MLNYILPKRLIKSEPSKLKKGFRVNWKKMTSDSLLILHQGAIERVQDTIKDHYEISRKYFSLLVIILSISSALCVFLFENESEKFGLKIIATIAVFMCAFIILIIAQNIRPIKFMPPGRVPYKAITKDTFENNNLDEIDIKKYLLYQELLECQFKIDINQYYNTKRLDAMDFIIRFMIICFIVLVVLLLITNNFI